jgi:hypothetical protein
MPGSDYDTTYYWKVRATSASTRSTWSSASVFTTESPPENTEPPDEPPAPTPLYPQEAIPEIIPSLTAASLPTTPPAMSANPPSAAMPQDGISLPALGQYPAIPGWITYLMGGLLLTIILSLIIILAMILKMRRF